MSTQDIAPCRIIASMKPLQLAVVGMALFAVLLILAQPVCQAYELGHEPQGAPGAWSQAMPDQAEFCCDDVRTVAAAVPTSSATAKSIAEGAALVSPIMLAVAQASFPVVRHLAASPPARPLSYYVRSTRILR
jgi:hypothetical protein